MKLNSWTYFGITLAIFGGFLVATSNGQFTTPQWPPFTESDVEFTTPNWPPGTETDEQVTEPGQPPLPPGTTQPPGNNDQNHDHAGESTAWMVTAIIFIVLTVALSILAIYMYVSFSNRPLRPGRTFRLPRVNP